MKLARRLMLLEQLAGPAECQGEFEWQIICAEEGAEQAIPDSICRKCGRPMYQRSPYAQAKRTVQTVHGVDESCFTGVNLDR